VAVFPYAHMVGTKYPILLGTIFYRCPFCSISSSTTFYDDDSGCMHTVCKCKNRYLIKVKGLRDCATCESRIDCLGRIVIEANLGDHV